MIHLTATPQYRTPQLLHRCISDVLFALWSSLEKHPLSVVMANTLFQKSPEQKYCHSLEYKYLIYFPMVTWLVATSCAFKISLILLGDVRLLILSIKNSLNWRRTCVSGKLYFCTRSLFTIVSYTSLIYVVRSRSALSKNAFDQVT